MPDEKKPVAPPSVSAAASSAPAPKAPERDAAVSAPQKTFTPPAVKEKVVPAAQVAADDVAADAFADYVPNDFDSQLEREHALARGVDAVSNETLAESDADYVTIDPVTGEPEAIDEDVVAAETPAVAAASDAPTAPQAEAQPEAEPTAATQAEAPAAKADPYDPNETIRVAEGHDWTRAQLLQALNVGVGAKQEADTFRAVFQMTAADAIKEWAPVLKAFHEDRKYFAAVQNTMSAYQELGPEFADYLTKAIDHYKAETGRAEPAAAQNEAPAQPQYAKLDPEKEAALADFMAYQKQREIDRGRALFEDHRRKVVEAHPIVGEDPTIFAAVSQRADYWIRNGKPTFSLVDAANEMAPWLRQQAELRAAAARRAAAEAAPAQEIPVLLSGSGAAPAATRQAPSRAKPKSFPSLDDAVAEWENGGARAAGFQ